MAQTYKSPLINNRPADFTDSGIYADILFDPDDSLPTYIGLNLYCGASTASADWKIYKFDYSVSNTANTTHIQLAYGAWMNRATLF